MPAAIELFAGSQPGEQAFQNLLVCRLNFAEPDSNSIRSTIDDLPQRSECGAPVMNPQSDFRPAGERRACLDEAAEDTQVARARRETSF
jgi:hypothetical protein